MNHRTDVKHIFSVIVAVIVIAGMITSGTALAASTTKQLSTNFTLVNFDAAEANVLVSYLTDAGDPWDVKPGNDTFVVPGNYGSVQIRQYFDEVMSAGKGSAVVSADRELGAVVQIQARGQTPTQGAYSGYNTGSNQFFVPLVSRKGFSASGTANSQIIIQNTSDGAVTVDVDLINQDGTVQYTKTIADLAAGVSYYYDLADELATNVPDAWFGSAVVTAGVDQTIAVVSNFFTGPNAMQTFNAFPIESVGTDWVIPLFFSRLANGLSTVVTVQNLSGADIAAEAIELTCTKQADFAGSDSFTKTNPAILGDSGSYSFNPVGNVDMFTEAGWGGSCTLTAPGDVVAFVQMRYVGMGNNQGAAAYEAMPATTVGTTLVFPQMAKRLPNGFATVAAVQNMDLGADATVTLTYTPSFIAAECPVNVCDMDDDGDVDADDAIVIPNVTIPAGGSIQRNLRVTTGPQAQTEVPDGWQGSLVVTADQDIAGFVQMTNINTPVGDTFMAHNGFTRP